MEQGDLTLPPDADVATFLLSDGKRFQPVAVQKTLLLERAQSDYLASIPQGALEANTIYTLRIHLKHLTRILGKSSRLERLTFADLQKYVDVRSERRGGAVGR